MNRTVLADQSKHLKRQNNKLRNLWMEDRFRAPECLINLSKKKLSVTEENLIRLGLKHHILPKELKGEDLKADLESLVDNIMRDKEMKLKSDTGVYQNIPVSSELKDQLKFSLNSFSRQSEVICSSKKNKLQHNTLKKLALDKKIKVCKFDKGNGVVILDSENYFEKLDKIILDKTKFVEVKMDSENNPGKLYGTCKVHKTDNPLRPVISMINTAEFNLAKWLDSYIKPNIPNTYSVSSTGEFLNGLKDVIFEVGDKIVSFDVVSLYTNIPLAETIDIVVDDLYKEESVRIPPVPKKVFKRLLQIATGGMFMHQNKLFKQVDGVAMGSPLGPSLANFFLGHFEKTEVFKQENICPKMYMRYVDDIFAVFPENIPHGTFLDHLNHLHKNLKFTVEEATPGNSFPFLNVEIKINGENVDTWVFRKKTDTGVMLNFNAVVPNVWKVGLIRCLLKTGKQICSSESLFGEEVDKLRRRFIMNGYPKAYFDAAYEKFMRSLADNINMDTGSDSQDVEKKYVFGIPYIGTPSREYKRKVKEIIKEHLGVDMFVYFSSCKVGSFFSLKSKTPFNLKARVLYEFKCLDVPSTTYIGKTERHIATRVKEHLTPKENEKSAITKHIFHCQTCKNSQLSIDNFSILKSCKSDYSCKVNEALFIKKFRPVLNKQQHNQGQSYLLRVF